MKAWVLFNYGWKRIAFCYELSDLPYFNTYGYEIIWHGECGRAPPWDKVPEKYRKYVKGVY